MVMANMSSSEGEDSDSDVEMLQDRKEEKEYLKRRRRGRKEEATYGGFGDMDAAHNLSTGTAGDGDIAGVGMNRRQRRKLQQERLSKPVGFVSASVNPVPMDNAIQKQTTVVAQENVSGQKDEEVDKGMEEGLARNHTPPLPPPPLKPVKMDANFGNWEKHTKGIGSKLLAKMGFTGRLGKQSTGVTRQVEVKLRPNGIGLGFGNFKEASTLKINREIEADRIGVSMEEEEGGQLQTEIVSGIPRTREGSWKKGKKGKPKLVMADNILEEERSIEGETKQQQQTILDMRGPQTRVITDAAELAHPTTSDIHPPALGEELLHNVSLVVSLLEAELRSLLARVRSEEVRAAASLKEGEEYENRFSKGKSQLERLSSIRSILNKVNSSVSVTDIAEKFCFLKENYSEEYGLFDLDRLVPTLGAPIVKKDIAEWKPLLDPSLGATILAQWKLVLCSSQEKGEELKEGSMPPSEANQAYSYLIQDIVLPKVRRCLVNEWNPQENPEEAIALLDHLSPVLAPHLIDSLALETVLPKLEYSVKQWDARKGDLPTNIHKWILPWRHVIGSKLGVLFPLVRRKLASALAGWSPPDPSALASLSPWSGVFDSRSMEALLSGSILPKLVHVLRDELVIDPSEQNLGPFNSVMDWKNILPHVYLASLFEGEFFGKWVAALHHWLSEGEANPEEVAKWYQGWKSLFPKSLKEDKRIDGCFNIALYLMKTQMERMALPEFISLKKKLPRSFQETLKKRKDDDAKNRNTEQQRVIVDAPTSRPLGGATTHEPLFRDVLSTYAEEHGVEFVPKLGRSVGGKQLYTFGGIPVLVDQLVHVEMPRGSGNWTPISVEVLMQKVKQLEK